MLFTVCNPTGAWCRSCNGIGNVDGYASSSGTTTSFARTISSKRPLRLFPGGAIAAKFATVYPSVVERLVLMAPAGLPLPVPILGQLGSLPVIGELLFAKLARPSLHAFVRETTLSKAPKDIQETMYARMTQCLHRDWAEVRCINLLVGVCVGTRLMLPSTSILECWILSCRQCDTFQ